MKEVERARVGVHRYEKVQHVVFRLDEVSQVGVRVGREPQRDDAGNALELVLFPTPV